MKKIVAVISSLLFAFCIVSCSKKSTGTGELVVYGSCEEEYLAAV